MGKFIDIIKRFFLASEKEKKQSLVLKSYTTQVIEYLETNNEITGEDLYLKIIQCFNLKELRELQFQISINSTLTKYSSIFKDYDFSLMVEKNSFNPIEKAKVSLSKTEYLAYLLGEKKKLLNTLKTINVSNYIDNIDVEILQTMAILHKQVVTPLNVRDAFSYFFIYEKQKAKNLFKNYTSQYVKQNKEYDEVVFIMHTVMDDLQARLGLEYIPMIDSLNYRSVDIFTQNNLIHSSFSEIRNLANFKEYFLEVSPMDMLDEKYFINVKNDCSDIQYVEYVLFEFFKLVCKDQFEFKNTNVFLLFWSNCTEKISCYDRFELGHAHMVLNRLVKEDRQILNYIIAVFLYFKNGDLLSKVPTNLPKILSMYFGENSLKEGTIKDLLTREIISNISFNKDNEYINDWAIGIQNQYDKMFVDSGMY
ncbi:hypothetical protein [Myroides sp. LoEW2-1]|uniref:hypothetical protein n=1 Tax=Myroides sp. LoEW2-1 TaxID=2683192 RepID=UPI001329D9EC|nr:hypothetical protein [Myroides sp. LoEW2-1]MVX35389.1 hypothetical protein [Myroides sp. LoEW2-1]